MWPPDIQTQQSNQEFAEKQVIRGSIVVLCGAILLDSRETFVVSQVQLSKTHIT